MKPAPCLTLLLSLFVLSLPACMPGFGKDGKPEHVTTYYIDAPNGFAMEYPVGWIKDRGASSVTWQPPSGREGADEVRATITSFSPSEVPGGDDRMLSDLMAAHPGLVLASKEQTEIAGSPPALLIQAHTPTTVILARFITTSQRAFRLEFSAPSELFDSYLPVFEEMVDSFLVLE